MTTTAEDETLRAARVTSQGVIELGPLDQSTAPGPGEVEIKMAGCGICGSNLHHLRNPDIFTEDRRHTAGALGHEMSGWVVAIGPDVTTHRLGDLVALEPQLAASCGDCDGCLTGAPWFCTEPSPLKVWGFADRVVVKAKGAWRLDPSIDPHVAAPMEALGVSVHSIRVTATCAEVDDDLTGIRIAVLGGGATRLLAVAAARTLGATDVACLTRHDHQAELAARLGAKLVIREGDHSEQELTDFAADVVVECVGGSADTVRLAMRVVRPGGEVSIVGLFDTPQEIDARTATRRELRLVFPIVYSVLRGRHDYEIAADMLREQGDSLGALVTHTFPLSDVAAAYEQAASKRQGVVRVVVTT